MDKILDTCSHGICLFSVEVMQEFLKQEKIRGKKIVDKFQKDKKLYLKTLEKGTWIPIVGIDSVHYAIKIEGQDTPFDEEWEELLTYEGFNLEVKNHLCVADICMLNPFEEELFSGYEDSYETMDGKKNYRQFKYDIPSGKYLINIKGYARKKEFIDASNRSQVNYGYWFSLVEVKEFEGYQNPREDELYDFNIGWLFRSREAEIQWLEEAAGEKKKAYAKREYCTTIKFEDGKTGSLIMEFDKTKKSLEEVVNQCRVAVLLAKRPSDSIIYSGAEHIIYKETYKRGKYIYDELGKIVIK
ncbi:MAG: hypothetical protein IJ379_06225 [Lachnospiraceae bacterium]|nr:hypothetical protein [Lachnospiraceae bacterium]